MNYLAIKLWPTWLACIFSTLLITGCVHTPNDQTIYLTEHLGIVLTAPPIEKIGIVDSHLVEIATKDKRHRFIAQVEYSRDEIAMVGVSPEGLPLFDFIWFSDKAAKINQYVPLPFVDIRFIIADMQLCSWPLEQIRASIIGDNVQITEQNNLIDKSVIWQRSLSQNNKVILNIKKRDNSYELENIIRGYNIFLTELNKEH